MKKGIIFVEALLVIPLLIIFLLGIYQLGLIWNAKIGARYAVFCAGRSFQVNGAHPERAKRAGILALSPVMPRITGVIQETMSPNTVLRELRKEVIEYLDARTVKRIPHMASSFSRKIVRNLTDKIAHRIEDSLNFTLPLPGGFEFQVDAGKILHIDEIFSTAEDFVGENVQRTIENITENISFEDVIPEVEIPEEDIVPSYSGEFSPYLTLVEKFITASMLAEVRILDENENPVETLKPGELGIVEIKVFYPLLLPIVRRIMGKKVDDLPDTFLGRLMEAEKSGYFAVIEERTPVRVMHEGIN